MPLNVILTPQSIDCPFLKIFECDVGGRRGLVEVKPMAVLLLLKHRFSELLFLVVQYIPPFWVNSIEFLLDHVSDTDPQQCLSQIQTIEGIHTVEDALDASGSAVADALAIIGLAHFPVIALEAIRLLSSSL